MESSLILSNDRITSFIAQIAWATKSQESCFIKSESASRKPKSQIIEMNVLDGEQLRNAYPTLSIVSITSGARE